MDIDQRRAASRERYQKRLERDPDHVHALQRAATARYLEAHPEKRHRIRTAAVNVRRDPVANRAAQARWQAAHPEQVRATQKRMRQTLRALVLTEYGAQCVCCAEAALEFLTIDHIAGGGTAHRKELRGGNGVYRWLRKENFPEGFQVLCYNCNMAKGYYGICPHQRDS